MWRRSAPDGSGIAGAQRQLSPDFARRRDKSPRVRETTYPQVVVEFPFEEKIY